MDEAEAGPARKWKGLPVTRRSLEKDVCADDVGLDEGSRFIDGPIYMRFSGEMKNRIGGILLEDP